jgi:hypothetical protein
LTKQLVKPVGDARVRDPHTPGFPLVPVEGIDTEIDSFWTRRRDDGDVTIEAIPEKPAAPAKK